MASQQQMSSNSSQVRVMSSSTHSYQNQPFVAGNSNQTSQQQFSMVGGSPSMQRRNIGIPIHHDGSNQQEVLQQQLQQQQMQQQQEFHQAAPHQQRQSANTREMQIPIQLDPNTPTPQPSGVNPPSFGQGRAVPLNAGGQGMAYGAPVAPPPSSMPMAAPFNASPSTGTQQPQHYQPQKPASGGQVPFSNYLPTQDPTQFIGVSGDGTEWPPQANQEGEEPNLTTVYPSNFKLRNEMPIQQEGVKVFASQPAFKTTKPIKMRGDSKWPPSGSEPEPLQQEVREFVKPKKQNKDYSGFFAQHELPSNYTGYRAPPGTQHVGCEDEDEGTDM